MKKILVTGVGGGVGQGVVKSLRMIDDIEMRVVTADMSENAAGLYSGDVSYLVPAASNPNYMAEIEKICQTEEIDYYFPGTDVELLLCANYKDELYSNTGTKIVSPPAPAISISDDKYETFGFLRDNGLDRPETWLPGEINLDAAEYPMIVKPRVGCRSIGVHLVNNAKEAKAAAATLGQPIFQEYLDGDEYTCTAVTFEGQTSPILCLRRDLRAGDTFRAFPIQSDVIESYVREICVKLKLEGSCNFQLRVCEGTPKLFEINSRFSGTTPFCSLLGFNPVEYYLKADLGLPCTVEIDYTKVVFRHWSEVVLNRSDLEELSNSQRLEINACEVSVLR